MVTRRHLSHASIVDGAADRRRCLGLILSGTASALAASAVGPRWASAAAPDGPGTAPARFASPREVAPGIFVHQGQHGVYAPGNGGDICNTGFIIGRDAVAVVDTGGTARLGTSLRAAIRALTDRPIRYVLNTHMHPDHVLGNAAFRADAPAFLGHHKLPAALTARAERYLAYNKAAVGADAFAGTEIVLPTETVEGSREIDLGGRILKLEARATAHTDNDLTILDTATGTFFTGDLVFAGHVPTLDGSIRGWLAILAELAELGLKRIVPGHGPPSMDWPAAADPIRRYLGAVASGVRAAIRDGHTMSAAIATVAQDERPHWQLFDEFHGRNVSAAFAELEWE